MALTESFFEGSTTKALLDQTIGDCLKEKARRQPNHPALVVRHQQIRWSYAELQTQVDRLATGLHRLGIEKGDRVGIWAPNCYQWLLVQFATARLGAIMVCINPNYQKTELKYALNKVQCKALVCAEGFRGSDYLAMLETLAPELPHTHSGMALNASALPSLRHVVTMGPARPGYIAFDWLMADLDAEEEALLDSLDLSPQDPINIQFTSGTTGNPKGATLSHYNILNNAMLVGDAMGMTAADKLCIPVPLYHCFGMVLGSLLCVAHGATAVFPAEAFDAESTLRAVSEERCTALHGVPTMFINELAHPDFASFDLSSLRTGVMAGATCPVELMKKVMGPLHMPEILISYGQTESSPINHTTLRDDPLEKRIGTVGKAAEHQQVKIVDAFGQVVPIGERGEICNRSYSVMLGYWDDPQKTAEAIDEEGWLHSGDLGVMDQDGYVQVVGRIKDMIIRGGENIYPREIEEFYYRHPKVQDIQVFGIPDDKYGEQVCAWVMLRKGQQADIEEMRAFAQGELAHFKIPKYFHFVEAYPMTVTGKIQKFRMRELMLESLAEALAKQG
ncbi:AMP-binding protein [Gallaecimonas kandeliae]|uniref:AMP-binding protein n=1 Tax=Gallaecimonas kandeliae TaxID=3029055 RepID=UPI00264A4C66|nr:AMP-binding protein [Gallaecimonas kandeliae]WKE67020.1 AMP-binding protein [Gallaecimonas kandeliae]